MGVSINTSPTSITSTDFCDLWFDRLQEIHLASTNTCYWGKFQFDVKDTLRVAIWLYYKQNFITTELWNSPGFYCAASMAGYGDPIFAGTQISKMSDLLALFKRFEASEPRDYVYAVLGMLKKHRDCTDDRDKLLNVNYSKSLHHVVRDAVRYALCQDQHLKYLETYNDLFIRLDSLRDHSPSWAPIIESESTANLAKRLPLFFHTDDCLDSPTLLGDLSHGLEVLLAEGFVADHVVDTTIICKSRSFGTNGAQYHKWLLEAKELVQRHSASEAEQSVDQIFSDMAFTVTAGYLRSGSRAQTEDLVVFSEHLQDLDICEDETLLDGFDGIFDMLREDCCFRRRFFATTTGSMGLGPGSMQAGDLVVVLRGGSLPFILREFDGDYQLIGPAYVHGIMDGEAVQNWKDRGDPEIVFPIH
jgi:hypothetical protein